MDVLKIAASMTHDEFSNVLKEADKVNRAGKLLEFSDRLQLLLSNNISLYSALGHAYYDVMIDEKTGDYKEEIKHLITK